MMNRTGENLVALFNRVQQKMYKADREFALLAAKEMKLTRRKSKEGVRLWDLRGRHTLRAYLVRNTEDGFSELYCLVCRKGTPRNPLLLASEGEYTLRRTNVAPTKELQNPQNSGKISWSCGQFIWAVQPDSYLARQGMLETDKREKLESPLAQIVDAGLTAKAQEEWIKAFGALYGQSEKEAEAVKRLLKLWVRVVWLERARCIVQERIERLLLQTAVATGEDVRLREGVLYDIAGTKFHRVNHVFIPFDPLLDVVHAPKEVCVQEEWAKLKGAARTRQKTKRIRKHIDQEKKDKQERRHGS